jgi:hypothetical protein
MRLLRPEHAVPRLPTAPTVPPPPGLRAGRANNAAPSHLAIYPDERRRRMPHRPSRSSTERAALLLIIAIFAALDAGIAVTSWLPGRDPAASSRLPDKTRPEELAPFPPAGLPPVELNDRRIPEEADQSSRMMTDSDFKPTGSGSEAGAPQTSSAGKSNTATLAASTTAGTVSVREGSPGISSVVLREEARRDTAAGAHSPAAVTCYPSAFAVRQDHPAAWPSWTLRAPGHEGTRCWYAKRRAVAVQDHRGGLSPKR